MNRSNQNSEFASTFVFHFKNILSEDVIYQGLVYKRETYMKYRFFKMLKEVTMNHGFWL